MQNRVSKYGLLFVLLLALTKLGAQSIEFSAKASKYTVAADEAFRLVYSVNSQADFTAPDLKDFKLLSGPSPSTYTQVQIVNGQMKNSSSSTWTLIVRPKKEGEFVIPPARVTINGKEYRSNAIKMVVGKASGNGQADDPAQAGNPGRSGGGRNAFCSILLSKNKVYVGEPLMVTYKLYSRFMRIEDYDLKLSTQKDVWAQELLPGKNQSWPAGEETVGGMRYMGIPIKKEVIFPQKSGKLKLQPFDMMIIGRLNFFESTRLDLVSNEPEIEVMPLPANAPASFKNAVGKFKLEASINKEEVDVNDGIDLTMKISGTGNLKLIHAPELDFPADFEIYDPETNDRISVTANGMSGSKEYKYLIIPRHSGNYTIEPVAFTYFDLDSKSYVTLYTPRFNINVRKGEGGEQQVGTINGQTDVEILDKEIRYLKPYESLKKGSSFFTGSGLYYTAVGAPLFCYLLLVFLVRRKKENYDPTIEKEKKAGKKVVKQLQKAQQLLTAKNASEFYTELLKGVQQYYCDKFNVEMVDFNRQRIREVLASKGVNEGTITRFINLVDRCEIARYASFEQGNESGIYEEAAELVSQLEKEVKA